MTGLVGLGVPWNEATPIAEVDDEGRRKLYLELFDARSFAEPLPDRVPWLRHHDRTRPLGWARPQLAEDGLRFRLDPIAGSQAATDACAEVRSKVNVALSIGFHEAEDLDEIEVKRGFPVVRRRGVTLKEVSLCLAGAYASARIIATDADEFEHAESERVMAPFRQQVAARRAADEELFARILAAPVSGEKGGVVSPEKGGVGSTDALGTREPFVVLTPSGAWCRVSRSVARDELDAVEEAEWLRARATDVARRYGVDEHTILRRYGVEVLS